MGEAGSNRYIATWRCGMYQQTSETAAAVAGRPGVGQLQPHGRIGCTFLREISTPAAAPLLTGMAPPNLANPTISGAFFL